MTRLRNGLLCKLGCVWYRNARSLPPDPQPGCTGVLPLLFYAYRPGYGTSLLGIKIAGRNQVGPFNGAGTINCGSTDIYVWQSVYGGKQEQYCDIWKAFADGIWASSVTIDIFALEIYPINTVLEIYAGDPFTSDGSGPTAGTLLASKDISRASYQQCANTALVATLTVNDDGTVSLA